MPLRFHPALPAFLLAAGFVSAQTGDTGPGGVGDSASNSLWLKADALNGASVGQPVMTWTDQSGNRNNADQPVTLAAPLFKTILRSGSGELLSALAFDGQQDYMKAPDNVSIIGSTPVRQHSVFIAFRTGTDVTQRQVIYKEGGASKGFNIYLVNGRLYLAGYNLAGDNTKWELREVNSPVAPNTKYFAMLDFDADRDSLRGFLNGDLFGATDSVGDLHADVNSAVSLGAADGAARFHDFIKTLTMAGNFFGGDLFEVAVYRSSLNETQRLLIGNYLSSKYNITIVTDRYRFDGQHYHEVAGVGRVDGSDKHVSAKGSGIVRIAQPSALDDGEHLLFGHNGLRMDTLILPPGGSATSGPWCMPRRWRVDEQNGDAGAVEVEVDLSAIAPGSMPGSGVYLIVSRTDEYFARRFKAYEMTPVSPGKYVLPAMNPGDGDFFTFGSLRPELSFVSVINGEFEFRGIGKVEVELNYVPSATVVFTYSSLPGIPTPTPLTDYIPPSGKDSIRSGTDRIAISIVLVNDTVYEPSELLGLSFGKQDLPQGIFPGNDSIAAFYILDDDSPHKVGFNGFGTAVVEADSVLTLPVRLNKPNPLNTVTVEYAVGGTATYGQDHDLVAGSLSFPPGQTVRNIVFNLKDDLISEPLEDISLLLYNPVNANVDTSASYNYWYSYIIIDNEPDLTGIVITLVSISHVTCYGGSNGQITISVSGGTGPYTVKWSSLDGFSASGTTVGGLRAGTYIVTVTDYNGNVRTAAFVITQPDPLTAVASCLPATCGKQNGEARVTVMGGSPPYAVDWLGGGSGATITGLLSGVYRVAVVDQNGCQAEDFCTVANDSLSCDIIIYSGFTPNDDGFNDHWIIDGIENSPSNEVHLYNRWGELVWSGARYDNSSVVWNGTSRDGSTLADGTYFYVVLLENETRKGWVELTR